VKEVKDGCYCCGLMKRKVLVMRVRRGDGKVDVQEVIGA